MFLNGLKLSLWCFSVLVNSVLFSGFLQFKGEFVRDQNSTKQRDWDPALNYSKRRLIIHSHLISFRSVWHVATDLLDFTSWSRNSTTLFCFFPKNYFRMARNLINSKTGTLCFSWRNRTRRNFKAWCRAETSSREARRRTIAQRCSFFHDGIKMLLKQLFRWIL